MTTTDGGPAFPIPDQHNANGDVQPGWCGMTLRDYFAAKALAGFCANPAVFASNSRTGWSLVNCTEPQLAQSCYVLADAMLIERAKATT